MVHLLDSVLNELYTKFIEKNMWDNTLMVFCSDNGGQSKWYVVLNMYGKYNVCSGW
jgi:arylsulfatase A-like enzyme